MQPSILPLSWSPLAGVAAAWENGAPDPVAALLAAGDGDWVHVLDAAPFDPDAEAEVLFGPLAWRAPSTAPALTTAGGQVAVRLSDVGFLTGPSDHPANTPIPGVLEPAYTLAAELGSAADPLGPATVDVGDVRVRNGTGDHDALVRMGWAGAAVAVKAGDAAWPFAAFATVLAGSVESLRVDEEAVHLGLVGRLAVLDAPLDLARFAGTGGVEGPAELAGRVVPLVAGRNRSVPMVLLDEGRQIWRAAESLSAAWDVRNKGLRIGDPVADHADYAALEAAAPAPGTVETCLALGCFRFGSAVSEPTADVDGPAAAGTTGPDIVAWLLTTRLGARNLAADALEGGSFNAVRGRRPGRMGLYLAEDTTARAACERLARGWGGWIASTCQGDILLGAWAVPSARAATIAAADVAEPGLAVDGRARPAWRVRVRYRPRRHVLSDMPETVPEADRAALARAFDDDVTWDDPAMGRRRESREVIVETDLDEAADAQALADALGPLLAGWTTRWRVPLRGRPWTHWLGQERVLSYPRFGLDAGQACLVVGVRESSDGVSELLLWGP